MSQNTKDWPDPVPRQLLHTRKIDCRGYLRTDGLFDIEASIIDTKSYAFSTLHRAQVEADEPLHGMKIRLTVDQNLHIHDVIALTEYSPYRVCPHITAAYRQLIGHQIAAGWTRKCKQMFGRTAGCTHLTELLAPMATVAFQTVFSNRARTLQAQQQGQDPHHNKASSKIAVPHPIGGCYALAQDGELANLFRSERSG
ncbi:MAG: DUF2889 domain-containing protein [Pseudomonadota bacterium]